jgi:hypothetical protein
LVRDWQVAVFFEIAPVEDETMEVNVENKLSLIVAPGIE